MQPSLYKVNLGNKAQEILALSARVYHEKGTDPFTYETVHHHRIDSILQLGLRGR